jgi:cytochrome b pre-mRNA-processing protein 3
MFKFLRKTNPHESTAQTLYASAVKQARLPLFYEQFGVADTPDGRFDMIMVHVYLILRHLKGGDTQCQAVAQMVFDTMFTDMDQNLREMGAGDIGVAIRIKDMAKAFYGRIGAYDEGLDSAESETLEGALLRNVYRKTVPEDEQVKAMASYIKTQSEALAMQAYDELMQGILTFDPPQTLEGNSHG